MAPEHRTHDEILAYQRGVALQYAFQKKYKDLADIVAENQELAKVGGKAIVGAMYYSLFTDKKPFDQGYQLTGDQLKILAHTRKAGAPVGEGDFTVHFDYVARIEREGRGYWAEFPDLKGCVSQGRTLTDTQKNATESLNLYVSTLMLHGDTLPKPKYHGRKTKKVRQFKVQLTLKDLVFIDDKAANENEQAREDFAYRTEIAKLGKYINKK